MKAVVIYEAGGPEKLIIEEREIPSVKPGWSRIKVKGFGINHSEIFTRNGLSPSVKFPRVLGIECVGIVDESTDENLEVGQMVVSIMGEMGRSFDGGYQEYVILPNKQIYPIDVNMEWSEIAAVPETYYTAYGSLLNLKINENDRVLVRGGTSGVGVAFVKLLKGKYGDIYVAGTSRSISKEEKLKAVGFDKVIVETDGVLQTEEKFDKILDLIGPSALKNTFKHLNEDGIVCVTGLLGGVWSFDFDPLVDLPANASITSFHSGNVSYEKIKSLFKFVVDNKIDVKPEKIFTIDEIVEAHRYLENSKSFGKIVVLL